MVDRLASCLDICSNKACRQSTAGCHEIHSIVIARAEARSNLRKVRRDCFAPLAMTLGRNERRREM